MRTTLAAAVFALACLAPQARAQDGKPEKRPRIGLVLSGGGARGAAHVGVLRVLEELHVPVDCVSGTSMGAIVGGLFAYGHTPAEIESFLLREGRRGWDYVLADGPLRPDLQFRRKQDERRSYSDLVLGLLHGSLALPKGLLAGQNLELELRGLLMQAQDRRSFDELWLPFRCVATDLGSGERVVLDRGDLPMALRASMSLPGFFEPVQLDGRVLVDGGLVANVPIEEARALAADVLIVVDIGTPPAELAQIRNLLGVTSQMLALLMQQNVDRSLATLGPRDVLVQPDLGDVSSSAFTRAAEAIACGESAARKMAASLQRYAVPAAEYAAWQATRKPPAPTPPIVRSVQLKNNTGLDDRMFTGAFDLEPGKPFDPDAFRASADSLCGWKDLQRVDYSLKNLHDGAADLELRVEPRTWGVSTLRLGLELQTNFRNDSVVNAITQITVRPMDDYGSEWTTDASVGTENRVHTEYYKMLDPGRRFFVVPSATALSAPSRLFANDVEVAELQVEYVDAGLALGANLGTWGELRAGVVRRAGDVDVTLASVPVPSGPFDDGFAEVQLRVDCLDNVDFPQSGFWLRTSWRQAFRELGADEEYSQLGFALAYPQTFGALTVSARITLDTTLAGTAPFASQPTIGGFLNLSGLPPRSQVDQNTGLLALVSYYRLTGTSANLGFPVYLGGSVEAGNAWARREDVFDTLRMAGSVFVGLDTPVGPMYVAGGLAEGGESSLYFFLGRFF
jgi:NTE family protein